jgi:hypothetical protein
MVLPLGDVEPAPKTNKHAKGLTPAVLNGLITIAGRDLAIILMTLSHEHRSFPNFWRE